jgi:hypothetical protein
MKKVLLYGAGQGLLDFRKFHVSDEIYNIVGVCDACEDKKGQEYVLNNMAYRVISPNEIKSVDYDEIIVTSNKYYNEIEKTLIKSGIDKQRIVSKMTIAERILSVEVFRHLYGIEVGGPSAVFSSIYDVCNGCDGVNWNDDTIWTGRIESDYMYAEKKIGVNYICDAVDLSSITDEKYDFYLSSNNLEHIANPIKALHEAVRVTNPGGILEIVVPEKTYNFDHNRCNITFEHLLSDEHNNTGEDDLTHLDEILRMHDLEL